MKSIMLKVVLIASVFISAPFAQKNQNLDKLNSEIEALEALRLNKLDSLEKLEAKRWNARYGQEADLKVLTQRSKQLESNYSRIAGDLSRKKEEALSAKQNAEDRELRLADFKSKFAGLKLVVKQNIEQRAGEIATDFPVNLNSNVMLYNELSQALEKEDAKVSQILNSHLTEQLQRLELSQTSDLKTKASVFEDGIEHTVWSLRFGTLYLAEADKNSEKVQILFNTGALQGKKYAWKSDFTQEFNQSVKASVEGVLNSKEEVLVSLDILQNGKIGAGILKAEEKTFSANMKEWFNKGGLVMYPLILTALLALAFAAERLVKYLGRNKKINESRKTLLPLINSGDYDAALEYCKNNPMGMNKAIASLIENRAMSKEDSQQYVKQILLREIPSLEKRLALIAALGAAAPLMGLLGTVSGMITLFKVITDVGTNDARILAGGISEALITTQTGLIIAIPILLIHGFLSERLDIVISKINESVLEVINSLHREDRA